MNLRLFSLSIAILLSQLLCTTTLAQTRYPAERNQSPITRQVAQRLSLIVADGLSQGKHGNRFIKVGDSITVSPGYFMGQYNSPDYTSGSSGVTRDLDSYEYLRASMEHFLTGIIPTGGTTSFERQSLAAQIGQTANWAVSGNPSPLDQELAAVSPLFAVIMFGTNDIGWWEDDHLVMSWIIENLMQNIDECINEGTVPILTAPPLKVDYELKMLTLSHLIRALAQARQIPFINYHRPMIPLPDYGLGSDGVHPSVYQWNWMCHLTPAGLQYGHNMHNLVAMRALDRALRATVMEAPALDFEPPALVGDGTQGSPLQVDGMPFIDTRTTAVHALDVYYALTLSQSRQLRFMVTYQDTTDVDVSLLDETFGLIATDNGRLDLNLAAGQYHMRIETRNGLAENVGEYQALIMDRTSTGMPSSDGIFLDGAKTDPSQIDPDQATSITFTVTALDDVSISSVSLDLSELGGGPRVAMTHLGDGSYAHTASYTVPVEGEKLVTITAQDDDSNQASIPVYAMVGIPPATLTVMIYDDAFASGWQDWSWNATIDLAGTSPVQVGSRAVNATLDAYGAFSPAIPSGSINTSFGYDAIKFWIHGGTGQNKAIRFFSETLASGGVSSNNIDFTAVVNTWTEITITLSELGNPAAIGRLNFFNNSGSELGMVTFDHIRIEPEMGPEPTLFDDDFESGDTIRWSESVSGLRTLRRFRDPLHLALSPRDRVHAAFGPLSRTARNAYRYPDGRGSRDGLSQRDTLASG